MHDYTVGLLAERIANRYGECPALRYSDSVISHQTLATLAERLALYLNEQGCSKGAVIALAHTKMPLSYALMLACLRLGLTYVVLDAKSPITRLARIVQTACPRLLFYDDAEDAPAMERLAEETGTQIVFLNEDLLPATSDVWQKELARKTRLVDGSTLAYIMFTSGSTGLPKGVAVTHQNVLHFISWGQSRFGITSADIFANLSPMYFDNSVFDFYVGLFSGASLAPVTRELLNDPYAMVAHVAKMGATIWFSVPSLLIYAMTMKALRKDLLPTLRSISFGGEGYPKVELQKLFAMFGDQAQIINVYGPTECTCICSSYTLSASDFDNVNGLPPLGSLNPNFDGFIEPSDPDKPGEGELILAGPNVAAGYYNDPERTQASFGTLFTKERFGKRFYRTGDLVREEAGLLYFLGRSDNQIKHMGYRIELEEVESALMRLEGVSQACVVYVRKNTSFGKLKGYVAYEGEATSHTLLEQLHTFLPAYMIPSTLICLPSLPKNANGKVDRQALKVMEE
ncbi:MAG: AMP-binding protein [Desulfovibrio sp.]|nr:AMP-binding protein [Desulfovibrio sp.]